jgi:hypothetical protein
MHYVFLIMRIFKWLLLFLPFYSILATAQLTYTFQNDILVEEAGTELSKAFSGGLIAPQFSTIDLNLDGIDDLFVFDRSSNKISTYLFLSGEYIYTPYYESLFPKNLENWVLLRDYNCDGKVDLFTSSLFGMSLYENTSSTQLSWNLKHQTIFTEGSNGQINLQVSSLDLPSISDVDNDGDLDILNFNFALGGGIEFHKNMSIENTGSCELELVRTTKKYGDFEECTCDTYVFGGAECPSGGREEHSGGKSVLSYYHSSDLVQDLLIGQEYCLLPGDLPNTGTLEQSKMTTVSFDFPNASEPLRMEYPAFYEVDLYNDGTNDLLASPNAYIVDGTQNYEASSFYYEKQTGGNYNVITDKFLKSEMIDVGHKASPAFIDLDFDGDEDLLIAGGINGQGASIWQYKNTGSPNAPSFKLEAKNYLNLDAEGDESLKLKIFDIDKNGIPDLVLFRSKSNKLVVEAFLNSGNPLSPFSKSDAMLMSLPELSIWDSPTYFDLSNQTGLLIGKQDGNLEYYITSDNLASASWQLASSNYLNISEDFTKRNLRVIVEDFDADGKEDMLSVDDSGEIWVYDNFLSENTRLGVIGNTGDSNIDFSLNFGNLANPAVANLFGTLEPSLSFGLLQGGLILLKSTQSTKSDVSLILKVIAYPNPVENKKIVLQANKACSGRILDVAGKEIINSIDLIGGEPIEVDLVLNDGIYLVEVVSKNNEKQVTRIVIAE